MVMANFASVFINKLQDFYLKRIYLPAEMKGMKNRCVMSSYQFREHIVVHKLCFFFFFFFFFKKKCIYLTWCQCTQSLCVRPWDDVLLVSVLKGQNVSGIRKDKGKRNILNEPISVVQLRTELLQRQCRFTHLQIMRIPSFVPDSHACSQPFAESIEKLPVSSLPAGTESCVDIYGSSRQMIPNCEFACFSAIQ